MSEPKPAGGSEPNEPYSASKHAIQGAGENVHEAKDSVNKAAASISNLVSGKGNMVDAAVAIKGAVDNVTGLTNRLSATAMMPVMKALSAFKGQAILPAGKQMDPVMGIDVHMVTIPPSPAPVPMPHPYIGILFNPKDWVSCLINTFKKDALDALPAPAEGDTSNMASIAKNKDAIAGIAMGLAGMSASVKFGGFVPRAVTGTKVKNIPHIPMGAGFHPAFAAAVAKNHGKAFLGSLFVAADGDPMVGSFHLNYDCWDIGVVDLFKSQRAGAKKAPEPGGPQAELYVPSGTVLPIPWGRPVLVNSIPTPINPMAILDRMFKAGLGKLKAAGRKAVQKGLDKLNGKVGCGPLTAVSKAIGTGQSHPVDVSGGYFYTDNEDFSLPGPIPLSWERTWYSNSDYKGPLGYGWHHSYDIALAIDPETGTAILRMTDGRVATFDLPVAGKSIFNRAEKLFLHLHEEGYYYTTDNKGLIYRFTQREYRNPYNNTTTHLLQSIANRNGFAIRFAYDRNGSLTQITDSAGRILTVNNDNLGRIISIHAPDPTFGGRTSFAITSYAYTDEGDMVKHTDALNQPMLFQYENHLMVKEIWRNNLTWTFRYNKPAGIDAKCVEVWGDGNLLHYTFDYTDPQCTLVINSLGFKKLFYHKNGVVIKYIDPNEAAWEYRYNKHNELEWETDPLGNQHAYTHDDWGNTTTSTDPAGAFTQTEYGKPGFPFLATGATDAAGGKWKWAYDESGNIVETTHPLGAKTKYNYHDGLFTEIISASGAITKLELDRESNLTQVQTDEGAITRYLYDELGNCTGIINPNGVKQKWFYDLNGRVEKVHDFDGNTIDLEYDGMDNIIRYRDKQKEVTYTYRSLWKLTSRTEAGATITFKYDTEEQLCKVINEQGLPYQFKLDRAGNVTEEIGFDGITRRYERNAAGSVTQVHRPADKFTKYEYDAAGRISAVAYSDGKTEQYSYRPDGNLVAAVNEHAAIQFERDVIGNILKESSNNEWIASEYDLLGNRTKITSSLGANITHQYSKFGDVLQMEANGWQAKFEYDKSGLETARFLPGGISSQWQRDGIGRPIMQTVGHTAGNNFNTRRRKQYQWDVADRLKQIRDENGVTRFEHDAWSNLAKTVFPNGETQLRNPDATGNLFTTPDRKDRVYAKGGQLKKSNGWEYSYDAEGNLIEKKHIGGDIWKYEWNDAGMLIKVARPDKTAVSFTYDALGRRASKQYKNTITKFVWDGNLPLHEWKEHAQTKQVLSNIQVNGNGKMDGITTWLFDTDSFAPCGKIKGDKQYSILTDHLGTPVQMYKDDGSLFWDCELDSLGKVRMEKGEIGSCPFRYQGQYEDVETRLYYNRFRYYASEEGMYVSQDPIGLMGGMASYGYVHDPNDWVDVFGLARGANSVVDKLTSRRTPDQQAVIDLAKDASKRVPQGKGPLSNVEADILVGLANEYGVPVRAKPNDLSGAHGYGPILPGPDAAHIHINGEHVPVNHGYQVPAGTTLCHT